MFVTVGSVVAGTVISSSEVYISRRGLSGGTARGVLWHARNSSDSNQYIGCKTMASITWCAARDRDGYPSTQSGSPTPPYWLASSTISERSLGSSSGG